MTQRRHFVYVAAGVLAAIVLIVGVRVWWQVNAPGATSTQPAEKGGAETPASRAQNAHLGDGALSPAVETLPEGMTPPTENARGLAISGCIRDTFGKPIRGAVVTCAGEDGKDSRSNHEGRYRIEGLPDRIFAVTATHPAYFPEQKALVPAGANRADFTLSVRASLEVQVVRSDTQEPLPQYFVRFEHESESRHSEAREGGLHARVQDPAGRTTLSGLEPIAGTLCVWQQGYETQEIAVSAGELATPPHRITVALEPYRNGLEGIVENTRAEPIPGAYILNDRMSWAGDVPQKACAQTGPDGRFRLEPTNEPKKDILAWHPDYAPNYTTIYPETSPHELLRIVLQGMATVRGRVTLDGEPLERCHVIASFKGENALDQNGQHTDADGMYALSGLPPGLAHVEARVHADDWGGSVLRIAQTAELVEGESTLLDFEVQRPNATLEGRIHATSTMLESVSVKLALETAQAAVQYDVNAETDGAGGAYYRIENVLPGTGILTVEAENGSHSFYRITRHGVTISAGEHAVFDITIGSSCAVAGRVISRRLFDIVLLLVFEGESAITEHDIASGLVSGEPEQIGLAAGTVVSGGMFSSGLANPTGEYAVELLEPGRYTVVAIGSIDETLSSDRAFITLREEDTVILNLTLR